MSKRRTLAGLLVVLLGATGVLIALRSRDTAESEDSLKVPPQPTAGIGKPAMITQANANKLRFSSIRGRVGIAKSAASTDELLPDTWEVAALSPDGKLAAVLVGLRWLHVIELATASTRASYLAAKWGDLSEVNISLDNTGRAVWAMNNYVAALAPPSSPRSANRGIVSFHRCDGLLRSAPGSAVGDSVGFVTYKADGWKGCVFDVDRFEIVERRVGTETIGSTAFPEVSFSSLGGNVQPKLFERQALQRDEWWVPTAWPDRFGDDKDGFVAGPGGYLDKSGAMVLPVTGSFESAGQYAVHSREGKLHIVDVASGKDARSRGERVSPKGRARVERGTLTGLLNPLPSSSIVTVTPTDPDHAATVALQNGQSQAVPKSAEDIAETEDGSFVAWIATEGAVRAVTLLDIATARVHRIPIERSKATLAPYGKSSLLLLYSSEMYILDAATFSRSELVENPRLTFTGEDSRQSVFISSTYPSVAVSPDQKLLAIDNRSSRGSSGGIEFFSIADGKRVATINGLPDEVQTGMQFSADGTELLVGNELMVAVMTVNP
jgi:hypothetical protein